MTIIPGAVWKGLTLNIKELFHRFPRKYGKYALCYEHYPPESCSGRAP